MPVACIFMFCTVKFTQYTYGKCGLWKGESWWLWVELLTCTLALPGAFFFEKLIDSLIPHGDIAGSRASSERQALLFVIWFVWLFLTLLPSSCKADSYHRWGRIASFFFSAAAPTLETKDGGYTETKSVIVMPRAHRLQKGKSTKYVKNDSTGLIDKIGGRAIAVLGAAGDRAAAHAEKQNKRGPGKSMKSSADEVRSVSFGADSKDASTRENRKQLSPSSVALTVADDESSILVDSDDDGGGVGYDAGEQGHNDEYGHIVKMGKSGFSSGGRLLLGGSSRALPGGSSRYLEAENAKDAADNYPHVLGMYGVSSRHPARRSTAFDAKVEAVADLDVMGSPKIFDAVSAGNGNDLKFLFEKSPSVQYCIWHRGEHNEHPKGHTDGMYGYTPMGVAILEGQFLMVEELLRLGVDPNDFCVFTHGGQCGLMKPALLAVEVENEAVLGVLKNFRPSVRPGSNSEHLKRVDLDASQGVDSRCPYDDVSVTPLMFAVRHGKARAIRHLSRMGVNLSAFWESEPGWNAVIVAAYYGHDACVHALHDCHVDINIRGYMPESDIVDGGINAHKASAAAYFEELQRERKPFFDTIGHDKFLYGGNAAVFAVWSGHADTVREIGSLGGILSHASMDSQELLTMVFANNRRDLATLTAIPAVGGRLSMPLNVATGNTAAHLAARDGDDEVIRILAGLGVSLDERNARGETPLYVAAVSNHTSLIVSLISLGVDPTNVCEKKSGRTVIEVLQDMGNTEAIALATDERRVQAEDDAQEVVWKKEVAYTVAEEKVKKLMGKYKDLLIPAPYLTDDIRQQFESMFSEYNVGNGSMWVPEYLLELIMDVYAPWEGHTHPMAVPGASTDTYGLLDQGFEQIDADDNGTVGLLDFMDFIIQLPTTDEDDYRHKQYALGSTTPKLLMVDLRQHLCIKLTYDLYDTSGLDEFSFDNFLSLVHDHVNIGLHLDDPGFEVDMEKFRSKDGGGDDEVSRLHEREAMEAAATDDLMERMWRVMTVGDEPEKKEKTTFEALMHGDDDDDDDIDPLNCHVSRMHFSRWCIQGATSLPLMYPDFSALAKVLKKTHLGAMKGKLSGAVTELLEAKGLSTVVGGARLLKGAAEGVGQHVGGLTGISRANLGLGMLSLPPWIDPYDTPSEGPPSVDKSAVHLLEVVRQTVITKHAISHGKYVFISELHKYATRFLSSCVTQC